MASDSPHERPLPADGLELAELGFDLRDREPKVTQQVIDQLHLLSTEAHELACADVLTAFQKWRCEELTQATDFATRAISVLEETDLMLWVLRAKSVLSGVMLTQGLHHHAIEHLFDMLELAEEVGDRDRLFTINHNLAAALGDVGDVERAQQRFALAEALADPATDDLHFVAFNRANTYLAAKRPHDARAVLERAAYLWEDPTPTQARHFGLTTQCDAALAVGELDEAERYLELAKDCLAALDRAGRRLTFLEARLYLARGRLDDAEMVMRQMIREQEIGELSDSYRGGNLEVLRFRVELAEARGDYRAAFFLQQRVTDTQVELLERNNHRVNRLLIHQYASELEVRSEELATRNDHLGSVVSELQSVTTKALELSHRDFLTGLHNRRHAEQEVHRFLATVRDERRPLSILLIDVDDFKAVNDEYLHVVGDDVLKMLSELMLRSVRKSEVVCRFGGDEFLILMPSTTLASAEVFAERLSAIVAGTQWSDVREGLRVSITWGAAQASEESTFESLFLVADERMLESKAERKRGQGRSTVVGAETGIAE